MSPADNGSDVQIARLEERLEAITARLEKVSESVDGLNKLAIQGRMAIIILVAIGSVAGWFLAQASVIKGLFLGR